MLGLGKKNSHIASADVLSIPQMSQVLAIKQV